MSKAILVIDMPKSCDECYIMCEQFYREFKKHHKVHNMKPSDCPLHEVPQKQTIYSTDTEHHRFAKNGYNACINEILKGVE